MSDRGRNSEFTQERPRRHGEPFPTFRRWGRRIGSAARRARYPLALLIAALAAGHLLMNVWAAALLNRELAAVRRRGEPLNITEAVPPPVPDAKNAALVYRRAASALLLASADEVMLRRGDFRAVSPDVLSANRVAVELTRRAAAMTECRFPVDYGADNLAGITLPHLQETRRLAGLMAAQAVRDAAEGRTEQALQDTAAIFRMSEHVSAEPTLITAVHCMTLERTGYAALAAVLEKAPRITEEQARSAEAGLPATDWATTLTRQFLVERCFGIWAFRFFPHPLSAHRAMTDHGADIGGVPGRIFAALWSPFWKMDEVHYLRYMGRVIAASKTPTPAPDSEVQNLPWYAVGARVMTPISERVSAKRDETVACRSLTRVALVLYACRARTGRFPASLDNAARLRGGALPHDPFADDAPFIYQRTGGGAVFRLYSIGPNRIDDGGQRSRRDPTGGTAERVPPDDLAWPPQRH